MKKKKHFDSERVSFWPSKQEILEKKNVLAVYIILRFFVLVALVISAVRGNYENVFICVLVLFLFILPSIAKKALKIELPSTLEIIILIFIFAAEILGELQCYYIHYAHWDTMLHTTTGFLCAAFGYSLIELLNREQRFNIKLSPFYLALVAFCFSMTIGVLWEFFEFGMDRIFRTDMQKDTVVSFIASTLLDPTQSNVSYLIDNITEVTVNGQTLAINGYLDIGLLDTMEDLFVNFIGAVVFSICGYIDAKRGHRSHFVRNFVPTVKEVSSEVEATESEKEKSLITSEGSSK